MLGTYSDTLNLRLHKLNDLFMRSVVKEKIEFIIIKVGFYSFVWFGFYSFFCDISLKPWCHAIFKLLLLITNEGSSS